MTRRFILSLALATVSLQAWAGSSVDQETENLVRNAAQNGHTTEGMFRGQPAAAVPVTATGPCTNVGIIQTTPMRRSFGGPRIENYSFCRGEVEKIDDVSPALPDDEEFKKVVFMTLRGATRYGAQHTNWQNYIVDARSLSGLDRRGCSTIETVVSTEGLLVSHNIGLACP